MKPWFAALALSVAVSAASPPSIARTPSPSEGTRDSPADKIICKRLTTTGSRLPGKRICRTQAQWNANDRDSQDAARKAQDNRRAIDP
jgi:hypothetical protein